jgi:hypothetical protein
LSAYHDDGHAVGAAAALLFGAAHAQARVDVEARLMRLGLGDGGVDRGAKGAWGAGLAPQVALLDEQARSSL